MSTSTASRFDAQTLILYAAVVFAWSTSWTALEWQVGVVPAEVSLVWRFSLAALCTLSLALWRGERLRYPLKAHAAFIVFGMLLFSTNFLFFYHAGKNISSGLLAVVFSLASVGNMLLGFIFFRQKPEPQVLLGGFVGVTGIGLLFYPEIAGQTFNVDVLLALLMCVAGTLCFCSGNMVSARLQKQGVSVIGMSAWGMVYGVIWLLIIALFNHSAFIIDPTVKYIGALLWLAVISSTLAFIAYLTLLGKIGSARAGYATVLFPIAALGLSTVLEGYHWTIFSFAGLALAIIGNLIVMRRRA